MSTLLDETQHYFVSLKWTCFSNTQIFHCLITLDVRQHCSSIQIKGTFHESQTQLPPPPPPRVCGLSIMTQNMLSIGFFFKFIKDTLCALGYIIWNHCFNDNNIFCPFTEVIFKFLCTHIPNWLFTNPYTNWVTLKYFLIKLRKISIDKKKVFGASEMAQWVRAFATKPDKLTLVLKTYIVEDDNKLQTVILYVFMISMTSTHPHTYMLTH